MIKSHLNRVTSAFLAVLFSLGSLNCVAEPKPQKVPTIDERIAFYSQKLKKHPTLAFVYPQLAAAYIDKTRATNDLKWLKLAETNLEKSMRLQRNFEAFKTYNALYNYRHRFAKAQSWGEKAVKAYPDDPEAKAFLVEADLGLGEIEKAMKRLPALDAAPPDFHTAVAMAAVLKAKQRYPEAREVYLKAEKFALDQKVIYLATWARTNAAGMLIDSKRAAEALPDLEAAAKLQKDNPELRRHWAEYYAAQGDTARALELIEALIKESPHPAYHRQAYLLARDSGNKKLASKHFAAAEKGYRIPLKAKEIFTLGALAQLYCDADTQLNEALSLASFNLEYKRDQEATDTLACVNAKLAKKQK